MNLAQDSSRLHTLVFAQGVPRMHLLLLTTMDAEIRAAVDWVMRSHLIYRANWFAPFARRECSQHRMSQA